MFLSCKKNPAQITPGRYELGVEKQEQRPGIPGPRILGCCASSCPLGELLQASGLSGRSLLHRKGGLVVQWLRTGPLGSGCPLLPVHPWATSWSLCFFICKMGVMLIIISLQHCFKN